MSMGYVFTKCRDGRYYRGLTYWAKSKDWFICFDEDEPLELVVKKSCAIPAISIVAASGISCSKIEWDHESGRCFGPHMKPATSYFLTTDNGAPFPTPRPGIDEWDQVYDKRPGVEGVYYGARGDK